MKENMLEYQLDSPVTPHSGTFTIYHSIAAFPDAGGGQPAGQCPEGRRRSGGRDARRRGQTRIVIISVERQYVHYLYHQKFWRPGLRLGLICL